MKLRSKFSDQDLQRIKDAVRDAEQKISGEIVPVFVERSANYPTAIYKSALIFSAIAFGAMIVLDRYFITDTSSTLYYDPIFIFMVVVIGGLIGALIPTIFEPMRRALVGRRQMDELTRLRAESAFLEEEVFNTRHRTGIMIFVSFFEHEVIVMADRGISKVVDQKEWDKIVQDLVSHTKEGKFIEGMDKGIRRCGEILLEKGFVKTADDVNELRDDLRIN